jgi:hypothetical protein
MSYKQIRAILDGGSMSTLSAWLRDFLLDHAQRDRLRRRSLDAVRRTARANHERMLVRETHIRRTTATEVGQLSERDLFIAGVVACAAEGTKRNHGRQAWPSSSRTRIQAAVGSRRP